MKRCRDFGGLLAISVVCAGAANAVVGCALTAAEKRALVAAEPAILAADDLACAEAEMLPVAYIAGLVAVACPLERDAVKRWLDGMNVDGGAPYTAPQVPTHITRRTRIGRLVHQPPLPMVFADGGAQ